MRSLFLKPKELFGREERIRERRREEEEEEEKKRGGGKERKRRREKEEEKRKEERGEEEEELKRCGRLGHCNVDPGKSLKFLVISRLCR